uniref:Protein containing BRCA1-IG and UBA4 domain n=1 Tax=Rhipicephalus zambeziensis TaxID=60191 RepID=A0A224Z178_9ACAR
MDIDSDLDLNLLQQFSCLGTTDRDVLICQLQKVLGYQLNTTECAFFLDMNNWNLQAAVCSYFDIDTPKENGPSMTLIKDVTIGDGEAVPPNTRFVKTWRIQNTGDTDWPPACSLKFVGGDHLGHMNRVSVESLRPGHTTDVSVEMSSPGKPGVYQGQWRMCTMGGQMFGEVIWAILTVAEGGLLAVTQQMEAFHQLGSPTHNSIPCPTAANPFASPKAAELPTACEQSPSPYSGFPVTRIDCPAVCDVQNSSEPHSPMQSGIHDPVIPGETVIQCPPPSYEHGQDEMMS